MAYILLKIFIQTDNKIFIVKILLIYHKIYYIYKKYILFILKYNYVIVLKRSILAFLHLIIKNNYLRLDIKNLFA